MVKFRTPVFQSLKCKTNKQVYLPVRILAFTQKIDINSNKQHYWELGSKGYSKNKIRGDISSVCKILNEYHCPQSLGHYFYELEK